MPPPPPPPPRSATPQMRLHFSRAATPSRPRGRLPQLSAATMIASRFAADASAFRAALLPSDIATIALSRNLFHLSWLLPLGLYALFEPPGPTRLFPMSISWTIRKGLPRRLHNALWVAGWGLFLSVVLRATGGLGFGLLLGGSSGSLSLVAIFILLHRVVDTLFHVVVIVVKLRRGAALGLGSAQRLFEGSSGLAPGTRGPRACTSRARRGPVVATDIIRVVCWEFPIGAY